MVVAALQWGRDLTDADGHCDDRRRARQRGASMGPRPNGRGWNRMKSDMMLFNLASMGPRPNGRGWT